MRGDRPEEQAVAEAIGAFTPHARGSTFPGQYDPSTKKVYPACAGIDPAGGARRRCHPGLPRMRGDRPTYDEIISTMEAFTPHARGSTDIDKLLM